MKVKTEVATYHLPVEHGVCVLAGEEKFNLVWYLEKYLSKGKKTESIVLDDDGGLIDYKNVAFISFSQLNDLTNIFQFKPKTYLNEEIGLFIEKNQEMFASIERIRGLLYELLTDKGFFKLYEILTKNSKINFKFQINDFSVERLLQSLCIDIECLSLEEQMILLYNLDLYINKNKFCIVYIDHEITEITLDWIASLNKNDFLVLINNERINTFQKNNYIDYFLLVTDQDFVVKTNCNETEVNDYIYCFHPHTLKNIAYQSEKNQRIINKYLLDKSTFLMEITHNNSSKSFI